MKMDRMIGCLRRELAAMDLVAWPGAMPMSVLEVGRLGLEAGIWAKADVKNVGLKEKEWSVLQDCAFDRVVLHEAVENCPWPEAMLNEVWRVVRPDGLVVVILPRHGRPRLMRKEIVAMMEGARLKVLALHVGGKGDILCRVWPWRGQVWWVVARKDVLNVRPLMDRTQGERPAKGLAGLAGGSV